MCGDFNSTCVCITAEGDMVSGERQVLSLAPWNKHDLSMRSFADRYEPPVLTNP